MILEQYYIEFLSHASYLIGDETTGRAIVVNPRRDITDYLADADKYGLRIEGVINAYFHADYVSGHLELVEATAGWIGSGAAAAAYSIRRLADGEHISLAASTSRSSPNPATPGSRSACWCAKSTPPDPPRC
jgi:hydroxyacylglutathione hydrolase